MPEWLPDLSFSSGPKYLAIAEAMQRDITAGRLEPGTRLPPQRALAENLGIDLTTVTRGYSEAQRRGLIGGEGRRGSFVLQRSAPANVDLSEPVETGMNAPPAPAGNALATAWRAASEILLTQSPTPPPFHYQPGGGMASVRSAGATMLRALGVECSAEQVVVTAGGQNGLHAILSSAFEPGDAVAVAPFTYPGFLSLARRFSLRLIPVATDQEGIIPEALAEACRKEQVRGLYVIPTNDNPTTTTMGAERRQAIGKTAASADLVVIEDDAYGLLPEPALPPLASLIPGRTFYVCSTSKIISPGLRVAWVRTPNVGSAWRLAADLHETAIMAPPFNAAVVSVWLETGEFEHLAQAVRAEARARQDIVAKALGNATYFTQPFGYHFWMPLADQASPAAVMEALRPYGLSLSSSDAFAAGDVPPLLALRASTGGLITRERLELALGLLRDMTASPMPPKLSLI